MRLVGAAAVARAHTPTRDRPRGRRADRLDAMDSEFWGCVIPAGRAVRVEVATDEEYVHVSQAALGADARAGRTTVTLAVADDAEASGARDGARHALCALTRDACDQVGMDVALDASFVLRATGPNDVHVTGWRTANDGIDEEEEARTLEAMARETSSEESERESEDSSDDEDAAEDGDEEATDDEKMDADSSDEEEEEEEDDDDDDFETPYDVDNLPSDGDLFSDSESDDDKAFAKAMGVDSEDDLESDEEEESDSDSEPAVPERDAVVKVVGGDSDSEDSDEEESDSEESDKPVKTLYRSPALRDKRQKPDESESESESESDKPKKNAEASDSDESESESDSDESDGDDEDEKSASERSDDSESSSDVDDSSESDGDDAAEANDDSDSDDADSDSDDESSDSDVSEDINVIKSATKRLAETSTPSGSAKKQKKESTPASAKAPTTPKTPTTDTKMNSDEYANLIVDYLKANPETMMSALGGRVKKPKNFPLKLGEFIKSRKDLFTIDGAYVRLVKK